MSPSSLGASILNNPFYGYLTAFVAGLATSLGPCTFARAGVLLGYTGHEEGLTKSREFFLAFVFLIGLAISYILLGTVGYVATRAFNIGTGLYYFAGAAVVVVMGLHFAGIVQIRFSTSWQGFDRFRKIYTKFNGPMATLVMGLVFGLMLCPCCIPGLLTIFAFTFAKGNLLYGISLVSIYTLGHGIPLLLVGVFAGVIGTFRRMQVYREHINLGLGTIMVVVGLLLIWIV